MAALVTSYLMLADRLEERLDELPPGGRLPSEHELGRRWGVSRVTARAALQELEQRHLVRRTRGSGTYVALRIPYSISSGPAPSWSAFVRASGHEPGYRILSVRSTRAPADVAESFGLTRRREVLCVERLGTVDGLVASFQTAWFPARLVPGMGELLTPETSTADLLRERFGMDVHRVRSRAELASPDRGVSDLLELTGRPLTWRIETLNRCQTLGAVVECSCSWMRADCFRVFLELQAEPNPTGEES